MPFNRAVDQFMFPSDLVSGLMMRRGNDPNASTQHRVTLRNADFSARQDIRSYFNLASDHMYNLSAITQVSRPEIRSCHVSAVCTGMIYTRWTDSVDGLRRCTFECHKDLLSISRCYGIAQDQDCLSPISCVRVCDWTLHDTQLGFAIKVLMACVRQGVGDWGTP